MADNTKVQLLSGIYCVLSVTGVLFLALIDPEKAGYIPACPWRQLTGLYCPGCGSLRAIHAITRLRFDQAFAYNILFAIFLPFLFWFFAVNLVIAFRGPDKVKSFLDPSLSKALLGVILVYFVIRNIPVYPFILLQPHSIK